MKDIKMNFSLDIFQSSKVSDEKGGFFLEWKKKMTIYADICRIREGYVATVFDDPGIEIGQKVFWQSLEKKFYFSIFAIESMTNCRYAKLFLKNVEIV